MKNIASLFIMVIITITTLTSYAWANWEYVKNIDDFDGDVTHYVRSSFLTDILFEGRFGVAVSCFESKDYTKSINFYIEGVLDFRSEDQIRLKFDSNEPEYINVNYVDYNNVYDIIFIVNLTDFMNIINKMQKHKTMKLEYYLYKVGRRIQTVDLEGFTKELNKLPSFCR